MIKKERLQELIEQNAIVYYVANNEICQLELTYKHNIYLTVEGYYICLYGNNGLQIYGDKLFESKAEAEDAQWHEEFGCIERTERLELSTWEEGVHKDILFSASGGVRYIFMNKIKTGYSIEKENPYIIRIQKIGECDNFIDYEYTKENYILACRKCKELFLNGDGNDTN